MADSPADTKVESSESQPTQPRPKRSKRTRKSVPTQQLFSNSSNGTTSEAEMLTADRDQPRQNTKSLTADIAITMHTQGDSSTSQDPKKKWHWTARVPGQILPTVVGPVGLGLCWKKMSIAWNNHTLEVVSWVILGWTVFQMTALLGLMAYRLIRYPSISILEQKHPTHFIFGILATLYMCLISSFIINWNERVASIFWYIGFATMCLYMVYSLHRWVSQKIPVAQTNAFYLFGPLPILLATQLAPYAPKDLLFFGWSTGTLWYFALHVLLLFRWIHIGLPGKRDRAAMWLVLAASSDSVLSYVAASETHNSFGEPAKAIFFLSILQFAVLLSLSPRIFASGFVATWWMTTLPSTAFSSSWIAYALSTNSRGLLITGSVFAGCATLWIFSLYVLTIIWIIRKDFWPKSPYRPPVENHPLH